MDLSHNKTKKAKKFDSKKREEQLRIKRERESARRVKIKNNPEEYEKQRERERQRYIKRKEQGKIKLISDLSEREKRIQRKKWVKNNRNYRMKKKEKISLEHRLASDTPPVSDVENSDQTEKPDPEKDLRRKIVRIRMKASREAARQKKIIESLKQENAKIRSKLLKARMTAAQRSPEQNRYPITELTPNTKVDQMVQEFGIEVPSTIKKELLFGECVKQQLTQNFRSLKNNKTKQQFFKAVGGKILKKYRVSNKLKMAKSLRRSYQTSLRKNLNEKKNINRLRLKNVKEDVISFFQNDENSRLCAGKKECITFKKVKKQKRYMNYSLKSLYKKYLSEEKFKISYSTFCRLRPFWVLPPKLGSRDTCLCVKHDNFRLLVEKLYAENVILSKNPEDLVGAITCLQKKEDCLTRSCSNCIDKQVPFQEFIGNRLCKYQQWRTRKETRISSKTGKPIIVQITLKEDLHVSLYSLAKELLSLLPGYLQHLRNIFHQHKAILAIKKSLSDKELLLHIDFSENYCCKYSTEAQSVHFGASRQQITLHTGVAYKKGKIQSFCTISSNLRHDPKAIAAHLTPVIKHFCNNSSIDTLYFLSDSPSTQYRNKTMFLVLAQYIPKIFPAIANINWSYSEAGHGKGAPDGVGATLKRTADRLVAERVDIKNYDDFLNVVKENTHNILIYTIGDKDILKVENELRDSPETFKGTLKVHNVTWNRINKTLIFNSLTCTMCSPGEICNHFSIGTAKANKNIETANCEEENKLQKPSSSQVETGNWVAVLFEDYWYPGNIQEFLKRQIAILYFL